MEGVSFDESSNEDDSNVDEQSLMQLCTTPPSESSDEDDNLLDLHVLALQPGNALEGMVMDKVDWFCARLTENPSSLATTQTTDNLSGVGSGVSHLHIGGEADIGMSDIVKSSSMSDYASLSSSDAALLDGPDPPEALNSLPKIPKVER